MSESTLSLASTPPSPEWLWFPRARGEVPQREWAWRESQGDWNPGNFTSASDLGAGGGVECRPSWAAQGGSAWVGRGSWGRACGFRWPQSEIHTYELCDLRQLTYILWSWLSSTVNAGLCCLYFRQRWRHMGIIHDQSSARTWPRGSVANAYTW